MLMITYCSCKSYINWLLLLLWLLSNGMFNHHHNQSNHNLFTSCNAMSGNTAIERRLETEFDLRPPRDYFQKKYLTEYLSVRQQGFGSINRYDKRGKYLGTDRIGNWELFAIK